MTDKERIEKLRAALSVDHDTLYPPGKCLLCDALREDYEIEDSLKALGIDPSQPDDV